MEFAILWSMSPCCLAADVSNEPTVSVICVDDKGTVTVVTASFCAPLHANTKLTQSPPQQITGEVSMSWVGGQSTASYRGGQVSIAQQFV